MIDHCCTLQKDLHSSFDDIQEKVNRSCLEDIVKQEEYNTDLYANKHRMQQVTACSGNVFARTEFLCIELCRFQVLIMTAVLSITFDSNNLLVYNCQYIWSMDQIVHIIGGSTYVIVIISSCYSHGGYQHCKVEVLV